MSECKKLTKTEKEIIKLLKDKDLSVTTPRKLILKLLSKEHRPFSAEEIFNHLPKNSCDQVTIYRCLNQFLESRLVTSTLIDKEKIHYEFNDPTHHHHHIICKICKKIDTIHNCILSKFEASLVKKGYSDIQHRLDFLVVCQDCQA